MRYTLIVNGIDRGVYDSLSTLADDLPRHVIIAHAVEVIDVYLSIRYKVALAENGPGIRLERIEKEA